jgi:hypothetical protein
MCLTTPATKTGFANVFVASPPKKGGEFLHYLLAGCVFPSFCKVATPRGLVHRARLGVRNDCQFLYMIFVVKSSSPCVFTTPAAKTGFADFLRHPLLKKAGSLLIMYSVIFIHLSGFGFYRESPSVP